MTPKQRYFQKKYEQALTIECACGCKQTLKSVDKYARPVTFINGHNGRKYQDPTQYKREWNHRNRKARSIYKQEYYIKRKTKLIQYKGSICVECNLKHDRTNGMCFEFHHVDPKTKLFAIGNQILNKSWKSLIEEADKCILLCSNCHNKRHSQVY